MDTTSFKVTYRAPKELIGQWMAENTVGGTWNGGYYNEDQKDYWRGKAEELIIYIKKNRLL